MPRVEDRGRFVTYPDIVFRRVWVEDQDNYYYVCLTCGWTCLEINFGELLQHHVKGHQALSRSDSQFTFAIEEAKEVEEAEEVKPKPRRMLRIGIRVPT